MDINQILAIQKELQTALKVLVEEGIVTPQALASMGETIRQLEADADFANSSKGREIYQWYHSND